jgi:hypothetical protein
MEDVTMQKVLLEAAMQSKLVQDRKAKEIHFDEAKLSEQVNFSNKINTF